MAATVKGAQTNPRPYSTQVSARRAENFKDIANS